MSQEYVVRLEKKRVVSSFMSSGRRERVIWLGMKLTLVYAAVHASMR